jgi:hypothetical protein
LTFFVWSLTPYLCCVTEWVGAAFSITMVRLAIVLPVLLAACVNHQPQEWSRPYEGYLPHTDPERFAVVLVRDKRTGRPIEGARLTAHPEQELRAGGWAPERARATTDEFGLAWIPVFHEERDYHWAVDAEGYAPTEEYGAWLSEVVELEPGVDRYGRILDVYGRPAEGVQIEYKVGCAHSPALRRTTTDKQGCFTLRCIGDGGDVPLEGRAIRAEYWRAIELSTAGEPVAEFFALPARTVAGQILDADGRPAAHARIHAYTTWRGPTTTADADGRFALHGAARDEMLGIHHGEGTFEEFNLADYRQDGPIVLQFGQKALEPETVKVTVDVAEDARVHFVRESDGRRFSARADEDGAWVRLPPGPYLLSAGALDDRYVAAARRVEVEAEDQRFPLAVEEQPALRVVVEDLPEHARSWLIHDGYCFVESVHRQIEGHYLAPHTDAVVITEAWGRRKVFPVNAAAGGVRNVVLDWAGERPSRIEFSTVPESVVGYRIPGARVFVSDEGDIIKTWATGRHTLRFLLDTGETHDVSVDLALGSVLQLEKPDLPPVEPRRAITVVLDDGSPVEVHSCWPDGSDDLTGVPGAHFRIRTIRPGDGFRATRYGRLEGAGPWTVRLGSAALRVTLTLEDGDGEDRVLYVDGEIFLLESGLATDVVGLGAGAHTLIVGAEGHVGRVMRVVLGEGETREVRVSLGRR